MIHDKRRVFIKICEARSVINFIHCI